jgi:hypothetical protein
LLKSNRMASVRAHPAGRRSWRDRGFPGSFDAHRVPTTVADAMRAAPRYPIG